MAARPAGLKIIAWTDNNCPKTPFVVRALRERPVTVSDYTRFWALYLYGGIYLDCDVEVLKPFDLSPECFFGIQCLHEPIEWVNVAVEVAGTGEVAGDVGLGWVSDVHRLADIGYTFLPGHRGNGYATEAAQTVLDHAAAKEVFSGTVELASGADSLSSCQLTPAFFPSTSTSATPVLPYDDSRIVTWVPRTAGVFQG